MKFKPCLVNNNKHGELHFKIMTLRNKNSRKHIPERPFSDKNRYKKYKYIMYCHTEFILY